MRCNRQLISTFVVGFGFGLAVSLFLWSRQLYNPIILQHQQHYLHQEDEHLVEPARFVPDSPGHLAHDQWEHLLSHMDTSHSDGAQQWSDAHDHSHEDFLSADLYNKVKIFCWIMTSPDSVRTKAIHVNATWVKRCNGYVFMSSKPDNYLPVVGLDITEGYGKLWGKTKAAFKYVYKHHLNNYDFFLKADDDSFVVMENLRFMLLKHNSSSALYTGRHFKPYVKQGYMSGGAGYVLSREAVRRLVEKGIDSGGHRLCRTDDGGAEDVNMGQCLEAVGVKTLDSVDSLGRERFHPFPPETHLNRGHIPKNNWLWSYAKHPLQEGAECCSDTSISFHYISPTFMYVMEYFVYHLKPFGVVRDFNLVKRKIRRQLLAELRQKAVMATPTQRSPSRNT